MHEQWNWTTSHWRFLSLVLAATPRCRPDDRTRCIRGMGCPALRHPPSRLPSITRPSRRYAAEFDRIAAIASSRRADPDSPGSETPSRVLGARPRRDNTTSRTFTRSLRSPATTNIVVLSSDSGPAPCVPSSSRPRGGLALELAWRDHRAVLVEWACTRREDQDLPRVSLADALLVFARVRAAQTEAAAVRWAAGYVAEVRLAPDARRGSPRAQHSYPLASTGVCSTSAGLVDWGGQRIGPPRLA